MFFLPFDFVVLFIVLITFFVFSTTWKPNNFPPGPKWLPIVGSMSELKKLSKKLGGQHFALSQIAKDYNSNVIGLKLGQNLVVTVEGYQICKAVLTAEEYEGRPDNFFIRLRCMGKRRGVTCVDGPLWVQQRSFVVKHLRNVGFGKKVMESMIQEEVQDILQVLSEKESEVELEPVFAHSILNVLWCLATGSRLIRGDPRLGRFLDLLYKRSKAFDMAGGTLNQMPWLRFIMPERVGFNLLKKINEELKNFFMETIHEHVENWYPERDDDLIYSFLSEMKRKEENAATFTYDQLIIICLDLFIAGSNTTSNTLNFIFLYLVLNPDVQEKAFKCIDSVLKPDEPLTYADRFKMPYLEAVILEVQRYSSVIPIVGPRRALRNTVLKEYCIPKDTTVLINIHSIHNDPDYWGDPHKFRPERFLDEQGQLLPNDRVLIYSLGKRRCLGDLLARQCIFVFFATILRKYKICPLSPNELPSAVPAPGIVLSPQKYKVRLIKRQD